MIGLTGGGLRGLGVATVKRPRLVRSRLARAGSLAMLLVLAFGMTVIGGCRGRPGAGTPTGAAGPQAGAGGGPAAPPVQGGSPGDPSPIGFSGLCAPLEVGTRDGVTSLGPVRQFVYTQWAGNDCVLTVARHGQGESLIELRRDPGAPGPWRARSVASFGPEGQGFYLVAGAAEGRSVLLITADPWTIWRYDPAAETGGSGRLTRLLEGPTCDVSPDGGWALLYSGGGDPAGPFLLDLETGVAERWAGVTDWPFPVTGFGASWSPQGGRYLYLERLATSDLPCFGLAVKSIAGGESPRLGFETKTLFWGTWSPNGEEVAFCHLEGDPSPYISPEADVSIPGAAGGLGVWDLTAADPAWITAPGRMVFGQPLWSTDGRALAFAAGTFGEQLDPLGGRTYACDAWATRRTGPGAGSWGDPFPLTDLGKKGYRIQPRAWAPGGGALLAMVFEPGEGSAMGYAVLDVPAEAGTPPAAPGWLRDAEAVAWLDDRRILVSRRTAGESMARGLVICGRDGAVLQVVDERVPGDGRWSQVEFVLSPDGRSVVWSRTTQGPGDEEGTADLNVAAVGGGP